MFILSSLGPVRADTLSWPFLFVRQTATPLRLHRGHFALSEKVLRFLSQWGRRESATPAGPFRQGKGSFGSPGSVSLAKQQPYPSCTVSACTPTAMPPHSANRIMPPHGANRACSVSLASKSCEA
jgi:hypothetical protein